MTIATEFGPQTAVIVVDMQNDFGSRTGSLYVTGAEEILTPINQLLNQNKAAGGVTIYTADRHPKETPHFVTSGGLWPPHGVEGTPGADLLGGLIINGPVVAKGTDGKDGYSGFSVRDPQSGESSPTVLAAMLREKNIERLIVVGLAGDYCVGETAIDGVAEGFQVEMPLALTRFVNLNDGDDTAMIAKAEAAGVQVTR